MFEMRKRSSCGHLIFYAMRRAFCFALITQQVEVMLKQNLLFAPLIKRDAGAKGEQAAKNPKQSIHAIDLDINTRIFKLEASPC